MSSWARIWIVFTKEVRDNFRDRRSFLTALLSALLGPLLLLILIVIMGKTLFSGQQEKPLLLPIQGAKNAPSLIDFLQQNGVEIQLAPADPEREVRNGNADVILVVPQDFEREFSAGQPATIRVIYDASRQSASLSVQRARNLLESYARQIASMRLMARGINPSITNPLALEQVDVATPQSQAFFFLNMMPYFIVLVVFVGGMYVVVDTTAGERERGSLEPLLINPVKRWEFVVGKMASSIPFALFTVFITLLAFALAFNAFPMEDYVGVQVRLDTSALVNIFLISLPMILLASSLQMVIATFTRSYKEAQTYVGFLPLIPALPGIGLALLPIKTNLWMMFIPTFGQQLLINQIMRDEPVNSLYVMISTAVTLVGSLLLIFFAVKLFQKERVLFGAR